MAKIKVAILFGGNSSEYEISLRSASSVVKNIDRTKYDLTLIGITKNGRWLYFPGDVSLIENDTWFMDKDCVSAFISPDSVTKGIVKILDNGVHIIEKIDVVFPILHGKNGEDGSVQGLLELSGIPFVGSSILASSVCMDKSITNTLLDYNNIKHTKWDVLTNGADDLESFVQKIDSTFRYPVFVKPCNAGSSVGVSKARNIDELKKSIKLSFIHDKKVLVEEEIVGREIEVAVIGNNKAIASNVGEIVTDNGFYDFNSKYINNTSEVIVPCDIPVEISEKIKKIALKTYSVLCCKGLSRVDFFLEKNTNEIYVNEVNTLPGFTSISMYPKLLIELGMSYENIIDNLIHLAIETSFKINI